MDQNKIEETEKRLQFTVVMGLFFPVALEALFNLNGSDQKEISGTVLKAGLMISILIANYLVFEVRKYRLSPRQLSCLNWIFLATIFCYALIFSFFGFVANGNLPSANWLIEIFYTTILYGVMYVPLVSIVIMLVDLIPRELISLVKRVPKIMKF